MPYAFDYAVASSYGASFAAREEESGRGTVGQFQLVFQPCLKKSFDEIVIKTIVGAEQSVPLFQEQADQSKQVTYSVSGDSGFKVKLRTCVNGREFCGSICNKNLSDISLSGKHKVEYKRMTSLLGSPFLPL